MFVTSEEFPLNIKSELPIDFSEIKLLLNNEANVSLVSNLDKNRFIPELTFLAERNGLLLGFIAFTHAEIFAKNKEVHSILHCPIFIVRESHQRMGIGSLLLSRAIRTAKIHDYSAVTIWGNLQYYQRFGFDDAANFGINTELQTEELQLLVNELSHSKLDNIKGLFRYK